jgi:hypothetical protein
MEEFGKKSPDFRTRLELLAGNITVDLLSQNEGRFRGLDRTQLITAQSGDSRFRLNADFNTAKKTFFQVDSAGTFIAECALVSKAEIHRRIVEGRYSGYRLGYVVNDAEGEEEGLWYLVLAETPSDTTYYEFDYYRQPTSNDTHIIRNPEIIKQGIRSRLADINPNVQNDSITYERMRQGFIEDPEKYATNIDLLPPRRTMRHNAQMYDIGKGL